MTLQPHPSTAPCSQPPTLIRIAPHNDNNNETPLSVVEDLKPSLPSQFKSLYDPTHHIATSYSANNLAPTPLAPTSHHLSDEMLYASLTSSSNTSSEHSTPPAPLHSALDDSPLGDDDDDASSAQCLDGSDRLLLTPDHVNEDDPNRLFTPLTEPDISLPDGQLPASHQHNLHNHTSGLQLHDTHSNPMISSRRNLQHKSAPSRRSYKSSLLFYH